MTTVRWRLLDINDAPLQIQPDPDGPLRVQYHASGRTHLPHAPEAPSEPIVTCECTTDALAVSIDITPDDANNDPLGESQSAPSGSLPGRYMWQSYAGMRVVLTLAVPETAGTEWTWNFANEPPIALKMKIKVKR